MIIFHRPFLQLSFVRALLIAAALPIALVGCAGGLAQDKTLGWSAEQLYADAKDEMNSGNWATAISVLEKLESRYPFGRFAQQAQIDTAYARWKEGEPALALAAIDRFIKLYPNHENIDYVLYLKGLINFNDRSSLFTRFTGEDLSERDPKAAREAFDTFQELVNRFPNSKYASDASARMRYLLDMLASNEVHVARFYMRRGAVLASVNRAQAVVRQYQDTPAVEEALAIMVKGYRQLGLEDLSNDARRVLQATYPQSIYLKSEYDPRVRGGVASREASVLSRLKFW
jgi:outer membrane protein assembly factor BamD